MDLEEWEFLPPVSASAPEDTFLDFPDDGEKNVVYCKFNSQFNKSVFNMDYFICPDTDHPHAEFQRNSDHDTRLHPNSTEPVTNTPILATTEETDQDISQVYFKKMKETEFADMKLDSPKSGNRGSSLFRFEDKAVIMETVNSPKRKHEKEEITNNNSNKDDQDSWGEKDSGGLNIFKWSLSGIGAICSFGVVAATVCIIALGSSHKNDHHEKLRFDNYKDKASSSVMSS